MNRLGSIGIGFVLVCCLANAQEVRFIDLVGVQQRTALRHPPAPPPKCDGNGSCVGGGIGSGSVGDGAPDIRDPHGLGVSLEDVEPLDINLEPFTVVFRLVNTGKAPLELPVSRNLSDLQPEDETKPFEYLSLALVIDLRGVGPEQALGVGWVELYGAASHPDSLISLRPGEWIRVKARVKLHTWPSVPVQAELRGDFWLRRNIYTPVPGGGNTQVQNLYPNPTAFPPVSVHFTPVRGEQSQP